MIGWLSGTVVARDPISGEVTVDVGGVGYQVACSLQTLAAVPEVGQPCTLWIQTHVREDVLALFGFASPAEKQLFLLLNGVPKVGPKHAMAVLGGFPLAELVEHLSQGREDMLTRIPGIGKKTAEQILLSLGEKIAALAEELAGEAPAPKDRAPQAGGPTIADEAKQVLVELGWRAREVELALAKVTATGAAPSGLDDLVRKTLAQLMER
jgi:Holliday junction DNA helicase RuvA